MGEFVANFQRKHGQRVPIPKIYGDEDSSDSESLEPADGTTVGKKAAQAAPVGANHVRRLQPVVAAVELEDWAMAPMQEMAVVPAQVVV